MIWKHNLYIKDKKLSEWLEKNLIYCEDTHSFVHRLFDEIKKNKKWTYKEAQNYSFIALASMIREYRNKQKNNSKTKIESRVGYIGDLPIPNPPRKYREKKKKCLNKKHY